MKENKKNIDQLFQQELGAHTESPPALVWESLEKRLDNKSNVTKRYWWFYLLAIGLFVGGSLSAYFHLSKDVANNIIATTAVHQNTANSNAPSLIEAVDLNHSKELENNQTDNFGNSELEKENIDAIKFSKDNSRNDKQQLTNRNDKQNIENKTRSGGPLKSSGAMPPTNERKNYNKGAIGLVNNTSVSDSGSSPKANTVSVNTPVGTSNLVSKSKNRNGASASALKSNTETTNSANASEKASKREVVFSSKPPAVLSKSVENISKPVRKAEEQKGIAQSNIAKAKPLVNEKTQARGLSAFPEEDAADLLKVDTEEESETDFVPEEPAKEKPKPLLTLQSEAINKARNQNPLSANPMATAAIDKTIKENDDESTSNAAGGGGASSAATKKAKGKKPLNMAIGVKMGYESGFQQITSSKYVGTIFAEVNLSKKLSFVMQPSIKMGTANKIISGESIDTFVNAAAATSSRTALLDTVGALSGFYNYYFTQNIDSMSQTASFQKKFVEIEIPFLFRYKVDKNFSVLAGINFIFGKTLGFSFTENKFSNSQISDSVNNVFDTAKVALPGRFLPQGVNGKSALATDLAAPISPVRFGYTLGLSYVFKEKFLVDLLVQQNLSGVSNISNNEVRKIFDQPYVRLSLGYTIFGKSKK